MKSDSPILLFNPPSKHGIALVRDTFYGCWCKGRADYMWPPISLAYLGATLKKADFNVALLDSMGLKHSIEQSINEIKKLKPAYIIVNTATITFTQDLEIIKSIKKEVSDVKSILVGTHVTIMPNESLREDGVDYIIIGEPDFVIRDLLIALRDNKDISKIKGVGYKEHGKIITTGIADNIKDLDSLPFPARELIPNAEYFNPMAKRLPYTTMLSCYDDKTEILTENGWKHFKDLKRTDKIATLNQKTQNLEYHNPKEIMKHNYNGKMFHIKTKQIDLVITPNHMIYLRKQKLYEKPRKKFELIAISDVAKKTYFEFKKDAIWHGEEKKYFVLPEVKHRYNIINGKQKNMPLKMSMDAWLEFLGYYLSEGSCGKKKNNIYRIKIDQSSKVNKKKYDKIEKCIKKLGYSYYRNKDYFEISNKQLYTYLKRFGKCYQKYIPKEIKLLSSRQLKILLDALVLGDGCIQKNGTEVYYSTSKRLIDDIQEIALKMRYSANYYPKLMKKTKIKGRVITPKYQCYQIDINKKQNTPNIRNLQRRRNIKEKIYRGLVYCCEVKNHIVYVRRNGKPCWSGNSRGCPFRCIFCTSGLLYGKAYRFRSAKNVVDEMEDCAKHGIKEIFFRDETFTCNQKRVFEICEEIKKRKLDMTWMCNARVDTVTEDMLLAMKKAGCHTIKFGVESGSQKILDTLKKGTTVESIISAFKWSRKAKLTTVAHFMVGSPGETKETLDETMKLLKIIKPDYASFNITTPYPGTEMWKLVEGKLDLKKNMSSYDIEKTLETANFGELLCGMPSEELTKFYDRAYMKFYMNPVYILKRLTKQGSLKDLRRLTKAGISIITFTIKNKMSRKK